MSTVISRSAACEQLPRRLLLAAGDFDLTFGSSGRTQVVFPGLPIEILDAALQADGKIVVAGRKGDNAAVARLNADGTIDTSFGTSGLFGYGGIANDLEQARGVAIQSDGRIVVAGFSTPNEDVTRFTVGRLTAGGLRDGTFGGAAGIVRTHIGDESAIGSVANDVVIQTDQRIVAAGSARTGGTVPNNDFALVRFNADGSRDMPFAGGDGISINGFGESEVAQALTLDYTGNPLTNPRYGTIVAVGQFGDTAVSPPSRLAILRLRPDGVPDPTFDGDGKLLSPSLSTHGVELATGVVVQPGGRIVAAGTSRVGSNPAASELLMARYTAAGALDTSFGSLGTGTVELDIGETDEAHDVTLGYLGGIVVSGVSDGRFTLAAFQTNGRPDTRFSGDGLLVTTIPGVARGIVASGSGVAPIRRLVVAGSTFVARFVDVGSVVFINPLDPNGAEAGTDPATFTVIRSEPQPFDERVFIGISGTATPPNVLPFRPRDYNGTHITIGGPTAGPTFVDIPAGQVLTTVTITPVDDTTVEGDETATFTVLSNATYDVGTPPGTTLAIRDNDVTVGPTVTSSAFLFETAPQRAAFTFNQNVSSSIAAADFRVTGPSGAVPFDFSYDAVTNTATLSFGNILPDGNYTARALAAGITNGAGQPMPADHVLEFFFLRGDANRDRIVNLADFNTLAANFGQSPRTFSQGDFTYDGIVNLADFNVLASRFGSSAAPGGASPPPPHDEPLDDLLA